MLKKWFDTRAVTEFGDALAEQLIASAAGGARARRNARSADWGNAVQALLQRVDREGRSLQLNIYKRAKLASAFKWKLAESRIEPQLVEELTQMMLLRLSTRETAQAPAEKAAGTPDRRHKSSRIESLRAQGDAHSVRGAYPQAAACYEELLQIDPRHAIANNNLGVAYCKLGRYKDAEDRFRRAVQAKHSYADAYRNLGTVLRWRGRLDEAETALRRAIKLDPREVEARVSLGMTLAILGRLASAQECFERALRASPRHAGALIGMAELAMFEGRFAEAEAAFKDALEIDPQSSSAHAALARLRKMSRSDSAWLERAERIAASGLAPVEESSIRFAIGKYWDDIGEYGRAFRSYAQANELLKSAADPYDRREREAFVADMARVYNRETLARVGGASASERPVFVVGMMRSGTSLIEQIISSHPAAAGAGELDFWNRAVGKHEAVIRGGLLPAPLATQLADAYLRKLSEHAAKAHRIVDKSTSNSDYLGVIHSVFPGARIIYVERDPIDTCLSCYFQQFAVALNFTMDLSDLAHYYRTHQRVVAHWRSVIPADRFLDVPYAELVADQEKWTRRILDFLGLTWDEQCLNFDQTKRPVLTASYWQVRQKIYRGSVGRWRNYEKYIGPLRTLAAGVDDA